VNLQSVLTKISTEPAFFFGRFYTVRKQYSNLQKVIGREKLTPGERKIFSAKPQKAVEDLKETSIAFGFDLPQNYVKKLYDFSIENPLHRWNGEQDKFYYHDVRQGRIGSGPVGIAEVENKENLKELDEIVRDPGVLDVVRSYLGYKNIRSHTNLFWTFHGDISREDRIRQNQTVEYHFDVHHWNFCYLHVYLTDCDRDSGAHELVLRSHKNKPAKWLWGSVKRSDEDIMAYYPSEDLVTVEAKAGAGFLEDTSCYHRALAPVKADRLMLQVRYF
jgi:hypothetical protein